MAATTKHVLVVSNNGYGAELRVDNVLRCQGHLWYRSDGDGVHVTTEGKVPMGVERVLIADIFDVCVKFGKPECMHMHTNRITISLFAIDNDRLDEIVDAIDQRIDVFRSYHA